MQHLDDLDTPALIVESSILARNLARGTEAARQAGISLRPHVKTHKCPSLALLQTKMGACGLTVSTLEEAEAFLQEGFNDLFLAYPVVGESRLRRFAWIGRRASISCAVDHPEHVRQLSALARREGIDVLVRLEIDCGHHRCGLIPGPEMVQLARQVVAAPGLILEGVFTHAGHAYGAASHGQVMEIGRQEGEAVVSAARILQEAGIPCSVASAGSTPTLPYCSRVPGVTEVRPGNYVFNDHIQVMLEAASIEQCALTVLTTVIGVYADRFVVDAGSKAVGLDKGAHGLEKTLYYGRWLENPGWSMIRLSEEHGIVTADPGEKLPLLGDRLRLIPNHACAAVNLSSTLWVVNGKDVVDSWQVAGRR